MEWREHIGTDPGIVFGKPAIKGTRIPVELILKLLAGGATEDRILENYPQLTRDDIRAAIAYAASIVESEDVYIAHV